MKIRKPRIGLLPLTSEWFAQVGATQGSFSSLPMALEADLARIKSALEPEICLECPGILASTQQVAGAIQQFQRQSVDAVVIVYMTWGEDRTLIEAVQRLGDCPFLLWCYVPFEHLPDPLSMPEMLRASGPVGSLQASGPLKRLGKRFVSAFGSPDRLCVRRIASFARAARLARDLKVAVIGVLPYRCDQMSGTYVDEFRLKHELGPELKYLTTHDYRSVCEALPEGQVQAFVQELRSQYPAAPNLTRAGLERGARVSLGLAEFVKQNRLDALAIEDVGKEMHRVLGLRPCLSVPSLFEQVVVSMEAEIGGAVALLLLQQFSGGAPVMYTELFTVDPSENCLLLGHAGMQDARLSDEVILEPDGEYLESEPDSAWMSFRARGGPVTLLSVFCDRQRFKLVVARGEALAGPRRLQGSPHAVVHLETPLDSFISRALHTGMTQHFGLVHGDVSADLKMLAEILDLEFVELTD